MDVLLIGILHILLYAVVAAICVYLIIWILSMFGFPLPVMVVKLLWAIVAIIVLIMVVQLLLGMAGGAGVYHRGVF